MLETIDALFAFAAAAAIAWLLVPRRGGDRLADRRDRPAARAQPARRADAEALRHRDPGRGLRLRRDLPALGRPDARDPDRRGGDRRRRHDRRRLRPQPRGEAARPDRRRDHPRRGRGDVDVFTLPFVGGVDPGATKLFDLPLVGHIDLGELATVIGIVAMANVVNLIDGVDGLAAGVCVISAATLGDRSRSRSSATRPGSSPRSPPAARSASSATASRRPRASWVTRAPTCSATCSASTAVQGALKTNAVVALAFPMLVLAVPILDTGFVVAKRLKYRRPIYEADAWHFHHRMANIGFSQRRTLAYLYGWTLVMAGRGAGAALRPLQRRPRQLRPGWTAVMAAILVVGGRRELLRDLRARDPQAAPIPLLARSRRAGRPPPRTRSTARSSASSRPASSGRSTPRRANSR